jgi:hypothetical protein
VDSGNPAAVGAGDSAACYFTTQRNRDARAGCAEKGGVMANFTQGPWIVGYGDGVTGSGACCHGWSEELKQPVVYSGQGEYYANNPRPIILINAHGLVVAHVIPEPDACFGGTNGDANAQLIAAAPEMYEALNAFRKAVEFAPLQTIGFGESMPWGEAIEKARAAIAKAEGR